MHESPSAADVLVKTVKDLKQDLQSAQTANNRLLHVISRRLMMVEVAAFILLLPLILLAFVMLFVVLFGGLGILFG